MSLLEQLRESRSKHTLKSYDAAVTQLRVFKAVQPVTGRKFGPSGSMQVRGLGCLPGQIPELSCPPDDEGNEHQISLILMEDVLLAPIDPQVILHSSFSRHAHL